MVSDPAPMYSFRRCPYAMRARMALSVSGRTCALREVVLRDKPAEMIAASPKATVPVLVLPDGDVIDESYAIMKWTLGHNDPDSWLSPELGDMDEIDALVAESDGDFKQHLDRYKYATRYDDADPIVHRTAGLQFIEKLDARLANTPYLFGHRLSVADMAIAPFIRQFANTDKDWFDAQAIPNVQAWLRGILDGSLFQSVMHKYPQWKTGDAEQVFP